MSFHLTIHAKKISAVVAIAALSMGMQALFSPRAYADETTENILVKRVDLAKKIAKDGIVETMESLIFAAPKTIKDSEMRYARICRYKASKNGAGLKLEANLGKLVSEYLVGKGYKNFNRSSPLQSELESQKFIFSKDPSGLNASEAKSEKAKLSKINQDFASYLEDLCLKDKISSSPIPFTYSPTHPAAVAPLQAGGYLFYSANNTFLPQIVFTAGEKIKNLRQSDFVKLIPPPSSKKAKATSKAPKRNAKNEGSGSEVRKTVETVKTRIANDKSGINPANYLQYLKNRQALQKIERADLLNISAPSLHVLKSGASPDYLWNETGTWITNPEDMSFSVGEMNPISYQVGTQFPEWEQMLTLRVYPSATFNFTLTPGSGESVMLNTIQVGGESLALIRSEEGSGSVAVKWGGGGEASNLNRTVEGNGKIELEVSLDWYALHYLRWHGAGINMSNGSSDGYGNLSIFHKTYFALDFIGFLNRDVTDTAEGVPLSASVTGAGSFDTPDTSPRSFVYVYTNGTPNGSGEIGGSFALKPEEGINNADSYGSPAPQTTNAGLWWKEEFPDKSCNGKVTEGAKFTVATLADTLYTGPGSDPSQGKMLQNGEAYLEPVGGQSQDPLNEGPSGEEFAGWAFGSAPVEYSSVYADASSPSLENDSGLFEIGGIANGVYIVSQVAPARNSASSSLPSFYITVSHNSPNAYSDMKDGSNISYDMLNTSTGTLQILPFCKIKELPLTGGKGAAQFLVPAFALLMTGCGTCGVYLWIKRKRIGGEIK